MIEYIIKYQNSFVFSHLFEHNLVDLLQKEVKVEGLFNSKILSYSLDFDANDWPATHVNKESMKGPYNGSIFSLRYMYPNVFNDLYQKDVK